jgi:hypothetical protein
LRERERKIMKRSHQCVAAAITGILFSFSALAFDVGSKAQAASGTEDANVEPIAIPVSPGVYLANFMILYFVSPGVAGNMPGYMAAIPREVYECLVENPEGCPYVELEHYFDEQALKIGGGRNRTTFWPNSCQVAPRWQSLGPPEYRQPDQISRPLGSRKADQLARRLGIEPDMVLTEDEYGCMLWGDPSDPNYDPNQYGRDIIRACLRDLTNSKGNPDGDVPLSSYGLSLDDQGRVRSNCAPNAPCLEFNGLAIPEEEGKPSRLTKIALQCSLLLPPAAGESSFVEKLLRLFNPGQTPLVELLDGGVACQQEWGPVGGLHPSCIVETISPGNGGQ